ncbi:uncharacterized protein B0T15DRAFT_529352 [Chaetomium strumarium]|uniref:Aminoglycoside phosphotransferase domain-containing protein n=1 Tax=Chaetomium strumarium TaxID=1170767 RepID=A0AAJ0M308_9PEZI|nr:hypothetical protein B0T15DRAFT_529352 [Chaetomium strumarium]
MRLVTNQELNEHREPGCLAVLTDRKYLHVGNSCIKRTLRRHEWISSRVSPPSTFPQRWKNDAAILQYLATHTNIPVPRLQCVFEDDGAFYHCTELVEGVTMDSLSEGDKKVVIQELLQHVTTLKSLRSDTPGVPGVREAGGKAAPSLLCAPERISNLHWKPNSCWQPRGSVRGDFVFCHNDLAQHNVIVDRDTLKIKAIIDWEFGGFWPEWFERPYWQRPGSSCALEGEEDDTQRCRDWLVSYCDEVVMPYLPTLHEKLGIPIRDDRGLTYGLPDSQRRETTSISEDGAESTSRDLGQNTY